MIRFFFFIMILSLKILSNLTIVFGFRVESANSNILKWGFKQEKQRYYCKNCQRSFIVTQKRKSIARRRSWFKKWIISKRTLKELSKESKQSAKTLQRLFKNYLNNPPKFKIRIISGCHLIIDGTYFKNNFCVLNYFDGDLNHLQYFRMVERENYYDYLTDLEFLKQIGLNVSSITSDGQKGLIRAINDVFPGVIHQRCVIHIQRLSLAYLTRFPKTIAGIKLRALVRKLHKIENYNQRDLWISWFENWCGKHNEFLKEKSLSFSGRRWYTHKLLRRTRTLIKNALPDMFHYLDDPKIPKSTNGLESRFSYLKNNLKIHRGLSRENRKNFIIWYYYFKYNS